jgi:uncharacterized SAM-binding protein YcdF (DUF218 family)
MDSFLYFFKRILAWPMQPVGITTVTFAIGIFLLFKGKRSAAKLFLIGSFSIFCFFSLGWTGLSLVKPLEDRAGPYADPEKLMRAGIRNIVVLSKSRIVDANTPADRWFGSLPRVMEGVRLWDEIPQAKLILSGSAYSSKAAMEELPLRLGIPKESLILETRAFNTADEARLIKPLLDKEPFALVTSAVHMPRSMYLFRAEGTNPIPCPCDYLTHGWPPIYLLLVPCVGGLINSEIALHEYYSLMFYWIKGLVSNVSKK